MTRFLPLCAALLMACMVMSPRAAQAACSASVSNINFGSISVRSGATNRTSGTITVECRGELVDVVGVCLSFGAGQGGASSGNNPRYMRGVTGETLSYQLRPLGYGEGFGVLEQIYVPVVMVLGSGSAQVPIYADVTSRSVSVGSGSYSSTFSGSADISMKYGLIACDLPGKAATVPPFTVSAQVVPSCELVVSPLAFGIISSSIQQPKDASSSITVRCTSDTSYTVSLGSGQSGDAANRILRNGTETLSYNLYQDPGRSAPWGDTSGTRASGYGTGTDNVFTVYGRIPAGQNAYVGVYTDNVVVTVNY
ncbi:spore coat protein U domain-containing protein [Sulfitobacter pseudonitzschiae]|uniref:Spore coat protein U domain-containing protein n=1 Tax=Pseudosulfitobacter pseudonitzschiae TaxID=1402135 RepID=A0A9Q2NNR2_9RHOB|nr:spore coat U domain-containing protein [Pseudosulfitobacter pseudonitzschiae]MBM2292134.1 spore coat protein U domain-containing protein [Pseudosulfitobacter pseudonitzschiae]MBM2297052.1 spore coat protein U domain-containing protein [Pseudosulfitobacter pseudonitzschiae]MBM2301966.1 spore coat protein U domain-containing protein [Pseudosulfitobacter pseudonitzschiae]MBM2311748.1 spore coat protein U domain-containing protein [Pseudosulfitobacter pseudonitzschiae]MBM2316662.1 spore coat pr